MGIIPASLCYIAYANEGRISSVNRFRSEPVLLTDYVPRSKKEVKVEDEE